jgi:hypothetical protein
MVWDRAKSPPHPPMPDVTPVHIQICVKMLIA